MRLVATCLINPKGNRENSIFPHEELGVRECLFESLEIVSRHIFKGENIDVFIPTHKGVNFSDNEFFVLPCFWDNLGQGDQLTSFCFGHQQSILLLLNLV